MPGKAVPVACLHWDHPLAIEHDVSSQYIVVSLFCMNTNSWEVDETFTVDRDFSLGALLTMKKRPDPCPPATLLAIVEPICCAPLCAPNSRGLCCR